MIEFGSLFILYFLSALIVAYRSGGFRNGIAAAVVSAVLSSAVWLVFVLLTFYIFRGTFRQEQVFLAEGTYEDFAGSGMKDLNAFTLEDLFGAAFFHLLLSPVIAAILGMAAGLFGRGLVNIKRR